MDTGDYGIFFRCSHLTNDLYPLPGILLPAATGTISEAVTENVQKILSCRTGQLGFHLYECPQCSSVQLIPHSCKSRFCSSYGKVATDIWTDERLSDILSAEYHHLVFTLPWQLSAICRANRKIMFNLLFTAAALSITCWAKAYGGYLPGLYIVLLPLAVT